MVKSGLGAHTHHAAWCPQGLLSICVAVATHGSSREGLHECAHVPPGVVEKPGWRRGTLRGTRCQDGVSCAEKAVQWDWLLTLGTGHAKKDPVQPSVSCDDFALARETEEPSAACAPARSWLSHVVMFVCLFLICKKISSSGVKCLCTICVFMVIHLAIPISPQVFKQSNMCTMTVLKSMVNCKF